MTTLWSFKVHFEREDRTELPGKLYKTLDKAKSAAVESVNDYGPLFSHEELEEMANQFVPTSSHDSDMLVLSWTSDDLEIIVFAMQLAE